MTQEVATTQAAGVPALAPTPANELSGEDIALPSIKLGQFMSDHVQEDRVPKGSIFSAAGADDPNPEVLWEQGAKEKLRFYVLALKKGKSVSADGELVLFDYNDPDAPAEAWVTYQYTIAIPAADEGMPYKFLLTRTGKPAAQQINTILAKNSATPAYRLAFELDCKERSNKKGTFYVPRVAHVEATEAEVEVAERLSALVNADPTAAQAAPADRAEEPGI
jgi:hypothetical protein